MESRRRRTAPSADDKLKAKATATSGKDSPAALSLPAIAEFIEDGQITIGTIYPVGCIATAADQDITYAMLVRRRTETLSQLLTRLDQALDKALTLGIFTDEVNR
jgi:hypothetical protein